MMLVKQKKAQVMILDVLIFIILIIIILSIETKIIISYKEDISFKETEIEIIKNDFLIEIYLLDCNYLGKINTQTKKCMPNEIEIKNIEKINSYFCEIKIDDKKIFDRKEEIKNKYKRGIIYKNKFSVLEVGFCE
ncbi:MAG: hypothetical protein PHX47_00680 [Candidatus ainarchaeum sp.]|jgi:hypothetical protein|nr:hypothetical protein [Candidatus ainarchaeum sp.]